MSLIDKVFSGKPSRADFAEMMVRALHEAGIQNNRSFRKRFFSQAARRSHSLSWQCLRQLLQRPAAARVNPSSQNSWQRPFPFPTLPSIPPDFATVKPSLMPIIRDAASFSIERLINRKNGRDAAPCVPPFGGGDMWTVDGMGGLIKPLAGGLVVGLAYDAERTITSIYRDHFEKWGVGLEEAFKAAKENLWEKTDPDKFAGTRRGLLERVERFL